VEVRVTHHVDEAEPHESGLVEWRYEYDRFEFCFKDRIIWARRYSDDLPESVSIVGPLDRTGRPFSNFYSVPALAAQVVAELERRGFTKIYVAGGPNGQVPLDPSRLKAVP
jgi:hypothetical protein